MLPPCRGTTAQAMNSDRGLQRPRNQEQPGTPKAPAIADDPPPPLGRGKENPTAPPPRRGQSRPPCRQADPPTKTRTNRPRRVRKRPRRRLSRARVRAGPEPSAAHHQKTVCKEGWGKAFALNGRQARTEAAGGRESPRPTPTHHQPPENAPKARKSRRGYEGGGFRDADHRGRAPMATGLELASPAAATTGRRPGRL